MKPSLRNKVTSFSKTRLLAIVSPYKMMKQYIPRKLSVCELPALSVKQTKVLKTKPIDLNKPLKYKSYKNKELSHHLRLSKGQVNFNKKPSFMPWGRFLILVATQEVPMLAQKDQISYQKLWLRITWGLVRTDLFPRLMGKDRKFQYRREEIQKYLRLILNSNPVLKKLFSLSTVIRTPSKIFERSLSSLREKYSPPMIYQITESSLSSMKFQYQHRRIIPPPHNKILLLSTTRI